MILVNTSYQKPRSVQSRTDLVKATYLGSAQLRLQVDLGDEKLLNSAKISNCFLVKASSPVLDLPTSVKNRNDFGIEKLSSSAISS